MHWLVHPRGELHAGALRHKKGRKHIILTLFKYLFLKDVAIQATNLEEKRDIQTLLPQQKILTAANISVVIPDEIPQKVSLSDGLNIAFCARINEKKGLDILLRAFARIPEDLLNKKPLNLRLIGPREVLNMAYLNKIDQLISELPQGITVTEVGGVPPQEILSLLASAHAYCLPTYGENFGHSIVEAMAAGCLPLISNQTPWSGVMKHGGWVHDVRDEAQLAAHILELLQLTDAIFEARQANLIAHLKQEPLLNSSIKENKALFQHFA